MRKSNSETVDQFTRQEVMTRKKQRACVPTLTLWSTFRGLAVGEMHTYSEQQVRTKAGNNNEDAKNATGWNSYEALTSDGAAPGLFTYRNVFRIDLPLGEARIICTQNAVRGNKCWQTLTRDRLFVLYDREFEKISRMSRQNSASLWYESDSNLLWTVCKSIGELTTFK